MSNRIKALWVAYDSKILLVLAIFLTAMVSFQYGKNVQKKQETASINVEVHPPQLQDDKVSTPASQAENSKKSDAARNDSDQQSTADEAGQTATDCRFVASKTSIKYHLPNCQHASKIKPGNRICFSSAEETQAKGFEPAKCCIK